MPRLFTGLEVPAHICAILSLKQAGIPKMRWIDPADFHITLRFIGDVSIRQADDIVEMLSRRSWTRPHITVGETKCFGGSKPSSLYASVAPDKALVDLSASQERAMQRLGLPPDSRRFTPHITIGRCKKCPPESIARYLSHHGEVWPGLEFTPTRFALYSARESRGGGPYKIEQTWSLDGIEADQSAFG
jgi:2'-5' RNA ligase